MKLTIITICFQNIEGLKKTIESLKRQSSFEFDQWIIDGASTDGTKEYLSQLQLPWKFNFLSEKDAGRYDAMNKGIDRAGGEYLWFLNAGDSAEPESVETILAALKDNADVDVLYGKAWINSRFGRKPIGKPVTYKDFAIWMPLNHQAIIYKREVMLRNPYPTKYRIISDWYVTKNLFRQNVNTLFVDQFLAVFELDGISATHHWENLKEQLTSEESFVGKLKILIFGGGKYLLIWLTKKLFVYDFCKRLQLERYKRITT